MAAAIEKKLAEAGYRMLGSDESIEKLIYDIICDGDIRYLKAVPFLIYKHRPDIDRIRSRCVGAGKDLLFQAIIAITARLFGEFKIDRVLPVYLEEDAREDATRFNRLMKQAGLDYGEFRGEFEAQSRAGPSLFIEKQKVYAERDIQMALSKLFTRKERQMIRRLMDDKPISKTDYEYYSRKTKKKLASIVDLQDLARALYSKTPKYDENLFRLKRLLEGWLEKDKGEEGVSILNFSVFDHDRLSVSFRKKEGRYSSGQVFNTIKRLKEIKDDEMLDLLKKYPMQEFG
ncbi:MAG: hypothetical protein AABX47_09305 [Nanoarchaeota archaeon]